jgi:hypothetical protein
MLLSCAANLGRRYIVGTWAFFALADFEIYLLIFIQSGIAARLDFRVMDEQIGAAVIRSDETKSLTCIEPFYFTCTHFELLLAFYRPTKTLSLYFDLREAYS